MVYFAYCVTDNAMIYEHQKLKCSRSVLSTRNSVTLTKEKPTNVYTITQLHWIQAEFLFGYG